MMYDENIEPQNINKKNGKNNTKGINKTTSGGGGRTIEEMYKKKSQLEHILLRPDTYVGSVEKHTQQMWVYDQNLNRMVLRSCTFVPGLYKIFDEIIVNAADNKQRDPSMNRIEVDINPDENTIRVWNNGNGIPVAIHQEHNIYVPELIFGHLLTGSNFDDDEQKTTGGRNGYGAKLANIFSSEFIIETADSSRGLKFKQVFHNNMSQRSEPEIKKYTGTDFTCVTFKPDLFRFKMDFLDDDIVALLSKRVFDIAGTNTSSGAKLNLFLNGSKITISSFEQYLGLFQGLSEPCAFERVNERWEVGVAVSDGSFQQVSYVNSICTIKGGQHVNYIVDQITSKLAGSVKKKNKGEEVKASHIKNHLIVFVNALVVNPAFDSQTKENLTTKPTAFGSTCQLSDKFLKKVENSGIIDNILSWAKFKQTAELKKKGGSKKSKLIGITKLDDANFAGTSKSRDCTLILTEGDSAKALAISGLGVVGRDYYGVFPLKGKLLNVREAPHAQIMKNEEIQNIAKILGLTFGKVYEETSSLRYGHLMIMTDQDHDGSHIKGLLINFLHHFWPSLLQIDGFLQQFITPIVKCTKGKKEIPFFTIPEYLTWKEENHDGRGWKIKYYKGLGTSTSAEAKEYFSNLATHEIDFSWSETSHDAIEMAFSKKRVDDRKQWLLAMEPGLHIDYDVDDISYDEFVNKELILFSHADNQRSIPHLIDGFKPSQRKVLYSCFKRNLKQEIKVAQLAGYVSEHSAYHHGEASLTQTIIAMAQNFVGCGNINLLTPCGQFGTRLMGGKDAASPRYVFTKLEPITRCIFHPDDDPLLEYLDEDGQSIEPTYYVPVIPMVLVNGSEGIGTGWSTSIPTYNPRDIIHNLRAMIQQNGSEIELHPWFRGFTGEVRAKTGRDSHNYVVSGKIEQIDDSTVVVSELPVGKSTTDYKQFLEGMLIGAGESGFIKEFKENHTDTTVLFTISIAPEKLSEICSESGGLVKKFKIDGSTATSNMHAFDTDNKITKYDKAADIMSAFYDVRMQFYEKRKIHLATKLSEEWEKLDNRVRFILAVVHGELIVSNRKKKDILAELKREGYKTFLPSKKIASNEEDDESEEEPVTSDNLDKGYDYLLSMKIWNLTEEKVADLCKERESKRDALDTLMRKSPGQLWMEDLDTLEAALDDFEADIERQKSEESAAQKKAGKASRAKKAAKSSKKRAQHGSDSESDEQESDFEDDIKPKSKVKAPKKIAKPAAKQLSISVNKPTSNSNVEKLVVDSNLSLAQRLMSRIDLNENKSDPQANGSTKGAAAPVKKAAPAQKKTKKVESDDEDEVVVLPPKEKSHRAAAAAASQKVFNLVDDDDSEDLCSEDEDDFDDNSESEFSEESTGPKRKQASKSTTTKVGGAKVKATTKGKISKPAEPITEKQAGRKRQTKSAAPSVVEAFSPGITTPRETKKPRKKQEKGTNYDRIEALVQNEPKEKITKKVGKGSSNDAAKKSVPAAKAPKAPKTARRIVESSDEEDEVAFVPLKSPKPVRNTRKVIKSYIADSDEEEEEEYESEEESEFED